LEFSVDGERPAFDGSKNFHFQIEHSDYNKLIFYLYVNSLLAEAPEGLKKIHEAIDKLDLAEIERDRMHR
jgi:hypothetical protein